MQTEGQIQVTAFNNLHVFCVYVSAELEVYKMKIPNLFAFIVEQFLPSEVGTAKNFAVWAQLQKIGVFEFLERKKQNKQIK